MLAGTLVLSALIFPAGPDLGPQEKGPVMAAELEAGEGVLLGTSW